MTSFCFPLNSSIYFVSHSTFLHETLKLPGHPRLNIHEPDKTTGVVGTPSPPYRLPIRETGGGPKTSCGPENSRGDTSVGPTWEEPTYMRPIK